jgi:hypothetical protein
MPTRLARILPPDLFGSPTPAMIWDYETRKLR